MNSNFLAASAIVALVCATASAAPPDGVNPDSPLAQWYRSLHVPHTDALCCSIADCRPVEARYLDGHWEILVHGVGWMEVPGERILHRDNPDGRPIACMSTVDDAPGFNDTVRCFVPPPET